WSGSTGGVHFERQGEGGVLIYASGSGVPWHLTTTDSKPLILNNDGGNIGIGLTNPIYKFQFEQAGTANSDAFVVSHGEATGRMYIDASDNFILQRGTFDNQLVLDGTTNRVGIGTTSITERLTVNGNMSATLIATPEICLDGSCITSWPVASFAMDAVTGPYLYNTSSTIYFNETLLNITIDDIASQYNETSYIDNLLLNYYLKTETYNQSEIDAMLA